MPLTNIQIKSAKLRDKEYLLRRKANWAWFPAHAKHHYS